MKKTLIFFIVFFVVIISLFFLVGSRFQKGILEDIESLPGLENLNYSNNYNNEEGKEKKFVSSDNELTLEYSSNWQEITNEEVLDKLSLKDKEQGYYFEVIFLAQNPQENQTLAVNRSLLETENPEKIIDIMTELNNKNGMTMEIIEKEEKDGQIVFEAEYEDKNNNTFYSLEKVLFKEEKDKTKIFIIAFIVPEEEWEDSKEKANDIINSAKLINNN